MKTIYEIKEIKDRVWGMVLLFAILANTAFCFYNDVSIYFYVFTFLLLLFYGIKTFPLCVRSTAFSIENENLIIANKHHVKCIPLKDITAIFIIERQQSLIESFRFRTSRYRARLCTKSRCFCYQSIYAPIFFKLPCDMDAEETKFKALFEHISLEAKVPIRGTGNGDNIFAGDFKYYKDYLFLIVLFAVVVIVSVLIFIVW